MRGLKKITINCLLGSMLLSGNTGADITDASVVARNVEASLPDFQSTSFLDEETTDEPVMLEEGTSPFLVRDISIEGLPEDVTLDDVAIEFEGKRLDFEGLQKVARILTRALREKKYVLSQVLLLPQEIKNGMVTFQAINGHIDEIIYEGDASLATGRVKRLLDQIIETKPIDKKVLERNLMLVSQLPGVDIKVTFRASEKTKEASTMIVRFEKDWGKVSLSTNNDTVRLYEEFQASATIDVENAFGYNSKFTLMGVQSIGSNATQVAMGQVVLPISDDGLYGVMKIDASYARPGEELEKLNIRNRYISGTIGVTHPLMLGRHGRLDAGLNVIISNNLQDIEAVGTKKEDDLRILNGFIKWDVADHFGGNNILSFSLFKGLKGLGSTRMSDPNKLRLNSRPDFIKSQFEIHRSQPLGRGFGILFTGIGVWSGNQLPSSERFYAGGAPFNRAYESGITRGDSALMGRLSFSYTHKNTYGVSNFYAYVNKTMLWTRNPTAEEDRFVGIESVGVGVSHELNKVFNGYMEIGIPLSKKVGTTSTKNRISIGINMKF
jgi:hemolysin activation/secretion protein